MAAGLVFSIWDGPRDVTASRVSAMAGNDGAGEIHLGDGDEYVTDGLFLNAGGNVTEPDEVNRLTDETRDAIERGLHENATNFKNFTRGRCS
jgi:hypothetical protein